MIYNMIFSRLLKKKSETYASFAYGRSDSHSWEKGLAANLIYQFIYRNWYGLGMPDIFPKDADRNHAMIKHFLKKHDLTLTNKILISDYPWLRYALENLKKTPEAYQRYQDTSSAYTK